MKQGVFFFGFGKALGQDVETNREVAERLGITEEEIISKSGITCRYLAKSETASSLARRALKEALERSQTKPADLSGIIVATFSGDYLYPNTASRLCQEFGLQDCFAFDVQANCAGFQAGLSIARDFLLANPDSGPVAVVGLARQSPYLNPLDPNTAYFFSDGASAVLLRLENREGGLGKTITRVVSKNYESVRLRGGGSSFPPQSKSHQTDPSIDFYEHAGLSVWKEVIVEMPKLIREGLDQRSWTLNEIDLILMHQANLRLLEFIMGRLRLPMTKTVTNVQEIGNTADASLGTVIYDAFSQNRVKKNSKVVLASVGAGFIYNFTTYIA